MISYFSKDDSKMNRYKNIEIKDKFNETFVTDQLNNLSTRNYEHTKMKTIFKDW